MKQNITYYPEVLDWCGRKDELLRGPSPKALYSPAAENMRVGIPEKNMCRLFCNGPRCKFCDPPGFYSKNDMCIDGLFSSWITENIVAISRPSTKLIREYKIDEQFERLCIRSIFNMQTPGEHSSCGHGLENTGFSYDQQIFMNRKIGRYMKLLRCLKLRCDFGVESPKVILDTVVVLQFAISEGKIAVHCHAGLGRTGVIIACYLIFNNRISAKESILYVRLKSSDQFTLTSYIKRQKPLLHGSEMKKFKYIPKIIYTCLKQLLEISRQSDKNPNVDSSKISGLEENQASNFKIVSPPLSRISDQSSTTYSFFNQMRSTIDERLLFTFPEPVGNVVRALMTEHYPEDVVEEAEEWKRRLNTDPKAYGELTEYTGNSLVLIKLMDDWLKHLRSPVLRVQDLCSLQQNANCEEENVVAITENFEKPVSSLLCLIAQFICELGPMPQEIEGDLIRRFICPLLQQSYDVQGSATSPRLRFTDRNCSNIALTRFDDLVQIACKILCSLIQFYRSDNAKLRYFREDFNLGSSS